MILRLAGRWRVRSSFFFFGSWRMDNCLFCSCNCLLFSIFVDVLFLGYTLYAWHVQKIFLSWNREFIGDLVS